jgi:hypothetical protein
VNTPLHQAGDDTHWQALAGILRQVLSRGPFTLAEAEAAFAAAAAEDLSPAAIEALASRATFFAVNGEARATNGTRGLNGAPRVNGHAALNGHSKNGSRKLQHEPLERRDLLTPLVDWLCGAACGEGRASLPPAPQFATACYAAAW